MDGLPAHLQVLQQQQQQQSVPQGPAPPAPHVLAAASESAAFMNDYIVQQQQQQQATPPQAYLLQQGYPVPRAPYHHYAYAPSHASPLLRVDQPPPPAPSQQQQQHEVQQAAQLAVQTLSQQHHHKQRLGWLWLVLGLLACLGISAVVLHQQYTIRQHEHKLVQLSESIEHGSSSIGVRQSPGRAAQKRSATPLDLFGSEEDSNSNHASPVQDYVYEFQMPSSRTTRDATGADVVRVPSERGSSLPDLDMAQLVNFDVCCRLDEQTFSCARGADVVPQGRWPSMSAVMLSEQEAQFLQLRVSSAQAYAGRRCLVRYAQKRVP